MADSSGGATIGESPEDKLRRLRLAAVNDPQVGQTGDPAKTPSPTDPSQFSVTPKSTMLAGTVSGSNPLGAGATPPSLGATGSKAVQTATGSAPLSLEQQQALGAAPAGPAVATATGAATVNPTSVPPGSISGVTGAVTPPITGPQPADLLKKALTGGPPPGFTGTFNGIQYSNGQPVTGGGAPVPTTTQAPPPPGPSGGSIPGTGVTTPAKALGGLVSPPPGPTGTGTNTNSSILTQQPPPGGGNQGKGTGLDGGAGGGAQGPTDTGSSNLAGQDSSDLGGVTSSIMNQLNDMQNQVSQGNQPADVAVLFNQQLNSLLENINAEEKRLRDEAQQAGTTLDPATEFTLGKLREELDRQLKGNAMALNARGLYDSGILQNAELELRKGNMSDQAGILSSRLSKINDDLTKSLQGLSNRKLDAAESYGQAGLTAQLAENRDAANRQQTAQQNLLSARMGLRNQISGENQAGLDRTSKASEAQKQRDFSAAQAQLDREYGDKQFAAKSAQEFEMNKREYEQKTALLAQQIQGDLAGRTISNSGGGGTANLTRPVGTTTLGQQALASLDANFGDPNAARDQSAVDTFNEMQAQLRQDGLTDGDIQRLQQRAIAIDNARALAANAQHTDERSKYGGLTLR